MPTTPDPRAKRRRWWWAFVLVNVAGLILIIPLVKAIYPLARVWWQTRSPESLREMARQQQLADARTNDPVVSSSTTEAELSDTNAAFQSLTNQLATIERLSENDIGQIVSRHFGSPKSETNGRSTEFDLDSAVFDSISRTTVVHQGKSYFGYEVKLVDKHGNVQTNIDCFAEPNAEYERSLATLQLINQSPQLKRIYQAMAGGLAERAGKSDSTDDASTNGPALRIVPGETQKR